MPNRSMPPRPVNNPNGVHGRIRLDVNDTKIWNEDEFLAFLVEHQNHVIDIEIPEGACLASLGLYKLMDKFKFKAVNIRTNNLVEEYWPPYALEQHTHAYQYFNVSVGADYSRYHVWNGKKVFGALYNRPTWSRLGLTGKLLTDHRDQTLINFRSNPADAETRKFFELDQLFQADPKSLVDFMSVVDLLPVRLEQQDGYTTGQTLEIHTEQLAQFYPDLLIDIVGETFLRGQSFYPTEKTTRPMLLKKPFIIMGSKCFLIHLRQMGFRTFHDYWDEDYDGYAEADRYLRILKLIDKLAATPKHELDKMYIDMQDVLDHNYKLLVTRTFTKEIDYVE